MKRKLSQNTFSKFYGKYGVLCIFVVEYLFFALTTDSFFTMNNLMIVFRQTAFVGVAAVGSTALMLTGGIDISSGAVMAFSGVMVAQLTVQQNVPLGVAIALVLLIGIVIGIVSGFCSVYLKVSPLIATLAIQTIVKGISFLLTGASPIYGISDAFKYIGQGHIGIVPFPVVIMIVCFGIGYWVYNYTFVGRYIYAVGGNDEAARLSGINTNLIKVATFSASSFAAALAGVMMAGRLGSGQPAIGEDFSMDVITAIVLGGVSITGGSGRLIGVFFGTLITGALQNGMVQLDLSEYWQWVVKGLVLIFAVAMSNVNVKSKK